MKVKRVVIRYNEAFKNQVIKEVEDEQCLTLTLCNLVAILTFKGYLPVV